MSRAPHDPAGGARRRIALRCRNAKGSLGSRPQSHLSPFSHRFMFASRLRRAALTPYVSCNEKRKRAPHCRGMTSYPEATRHVA